MAEAGKGSRPRPQRLTPLVGKPEESEVRTELLQVRRSLIRGPRAPPRWLRAAGADYGLDLSSQARPPSAERMTRPSWRAT